MSTPAVIAHRGASGYRPEHTDAAYRLAYRMGADSLELDIVMTRDGVAVCRHDIDLGRTTDVALRPEFADRARTVRRSTGTATVWWVHDFTLAEVRSLQTRERWPKKRPESAAYDGEGKVLTLDDVLNLRAEEERMQGRPLGLHVELKDPARFADNGLSMTDAVVQVLERRGVSRYGSGVTLMSFDKQAVRELATMVEVPRVVLTTKPVAARNLDKIADYADAIGVQKDLLVPWLPRGGDGAENGGRLVQRAHERDLGVFVWTLRNENQYLPAHLRYGVQPRRHGNAAAEVRLFLRAGVDALITDFPDVAVGEAALAEQPIAL